MLCMSYVQVAGFIKEQYIVNSQNDFLIYI
jgi:hypothetical protein